MRCPTQHLPMLACSPSQDHSCAARQGGLAGLRQASRARLGMSKQATSAAYLQHVLRMERVDLDP